MNSIVEADLNAIIGTDLPWETLKGSTVLVTGAYGFLPSFMVETLLHLNRKKHLNITVLGLVRDLRKARRRFSHRSGDRNLVFLEGDVNETLQPDREIHHVIHAASLASPKRFSEDPVGTLTPNVIGTHQLLRLAHRQPALSTFLFFSTTGVYGFVGEDQYPIREDSFGILNPADLASCYVESKRMGENMCISWMHQFGIPVKILRPAITYGPGVPLDDGRSFADFIAAVVHHRDIELYSDGSAVRNFCYWADAVAGFFTVWLRGAVGEAYNIATDHEIRIVDLARLLVEDVFPERNLRVVRKEVSSKNYLRMNYPRTTVDITKAKDLGWRLSFPIEAGFRRTVQAIEEEAGT